MRRFIISPAHSRRTAQSPITKLARFAYGAMQPSARVASNGRFKIQERSLVVAALAGRFCPVAVIAERQLQRLSRVEMRH